MFDLKSFRTKRNITQQEIEDTSGVSRSSLSKYENGKERPVRITKLLLKHYPEIAEYELDPEEEGMDYKKLYKDSQEKIKDMKEQYATLKSALDMIKQMMNKDQ